MYTKIKYLKHTQKNFPHRLRYLNKDPQVLVRFKEVVEPLGGGDLWEEVVPGVCL